LTAKNSYCRIFLFFLLAVPLFAEEIKVIRGNDSSFPQTFRGLKESRYLYFGKADLAEGMIIELFSPANAPAGQAARAQILIVGRRRPAGANSGNEILLSPAASDAFRVRNEKFLIIHPGKEQLLNEAAQFTPESPTDRVMPAAAEPAEQAAPPAYEKFDQNPEEPFPLPPASEPEEETFPTEEAIIDETEAFNAEDDALLPAEDETFSPWEETPDETPLPDDYFNEALREDEEEFLTETDSEPNFEDEPETIGTDLPDESETFTPWEDLSDETPLPDDYFNEPSAASEEDFFTETADEPFTDAEPVFDAARSGSSAPAASNPGVSDTDLPDESETFTPWEDFSDETPLPDDYFDEPSAASEEDFFTETADEPFTDVEPVFDAAEIPDSTALPRENDTVMPWGKNANEPEPAADYFNEPQTPAGEDNFFSSENEEVIDSFFEEPAPAAEPEDAESENALEEEYFSDNTQSGTDFFLEEAEERPAYDANPVTEAELIDEYEEGIAAVPAKETPAQPVPPAEKAGQTGSATGSYNKINETDKNLLRRYLIEKPAANMFYLQLGLFGKTENVLKIINRLKSYLPVVVVPVERNGVTLYRVLAGAFKADDLGLAANRAGALGFHDFFLYSTYK
jgi:cell division septation protein DedD